mmetsp:Transcript_16248/g.50447  ORF Transcript_16248/g.50447 Transcript_16248/m.50447 type:complete len:274 (-) Transcript_16248:88-909(-)
MRREWRRQRRRREEWYDHPLCVRLGLMQERAACVQRWFRARGGCGVVGVRMRLGARRRCRALHVEVVGGGVHAGRGLRLRHGSEVGTSGVRRGDTRRVPVEAKVGGSRRRRVAVGGWWWLLHSASRSNKDVHRELGYLWVTPAGFSRRRERGRRREHFRASANGHGADGNEQRGRNGPRDSQRRLGHLMSLECCGGVLTTQRVKVCAGVAAVSRSARQVGRKEGRAGCQGFLQKTMLRSQESRPTPLDWVDSGGSPSAPTACLTRIHGTHKYR